MGNALAPTLRADNIAVINLDPGFARTEHVELLGERDLVDADAAAPMSATADALLDSSPIPTTRSIAAAPSCECKRPTVAAYRLPEIVKSDRQPSNR